MSEKVNIRLRPFDALAILSFMREYVNESNKDEPLLSAIHETVDAYEKEVYKKIDYDQLEDACVECSVNYLAGRQPKREK